MIIILIVEDEAIARISLEHILTLEGYSVLVAENGEQALSYLRRGDIALVILDLKMTAMSRIEILERIQGISPSPKVIIATTHGSNEITHQALGYQVVEFLPKPYHPDELIRKVRHSLMGNNQLPEGKPLKPIRFDETSHVYTLRNEIEININRREVIGSLGVISLTPAEAGLLEALLNQYGNVVSHVELVKEIHGYSLPRNEAAQIIRPIMCRLRSKLKQINGADDWMMNIRGSGYLFEMK